MNCEKCSSKMALTNTVGTMETFECPKCGFEIVSHYTPDVYSKLYEESKVKYRVFVKWKTGFPSTKEIIGIRKLVPNFVNLSLANFLKKVREEKYVDLGDYSPGEAKELQNKGEKLGINIEIQNQETLKIK